MTQSVPLAAADAHVTLEAATSASRAVQTNATRTLGGVDRLSLAGSRDLADAGLRLDVVLARAAAALAQADTLTVSLNTATAARLPERADLAATLAIAPRAQALCAG